MDVRLVFVRDRNDKKKWIGFICTDLTLTEEQIIAHTTIVMTRYIMLAVENRNNKDDRTMGELFFLVHDELQDVNFPEVLRVILDI